MNHVVAAKNDSGLTSLKHTIFEFELQNPLAPKYGFVSRHLRGLKHVEASKAFKGMILLVKGDDPLGAVRSMHGLDMTARLREHLSRRRLRSRERRVGRCYRFSPRKGPKSLDQILFFCFSEPRLR